MATDSVRQSALERIQSGNSTGNFATIYEGFVAKGIPIADITPRVNVLTLRAWNELGRCVKRGEHGVKIVAVVTMTKVGTSDSPPTTYRRPRSTTVFHWTQTEAMGSP